MNGARHAHVRQVWHRPDDDARRVVRRRSVVELVDEEHRVEDGQHVTAAVWTRTVVGRCMVHAVIWA